MGDIPNTKHCLACQLKSSYMKFQRKTLDPARLDAKSHVRGVDLKIGWGGLPNVCTRSTHKGQSGGARGFSHVVVSAHIHTTSVDSIGIEMTARQLPGSVVDSCPTAV